MWEYALFTWQRICWPRNSHLLHQNTYCFSADIFKPQHCPLRLSDQPESHWVTSGQEGGRVSLCVYPCPQNPGRSDWGGPGLLVQQHLLCPCCPTHPPFRTPKRVQISDHGVLRPGNREGTDYALETGWVNTSTIIFFLIFSWIKNE